MPPACACRCSGPPGWWSGPTAASGNSGNSTEPHLHFQLMDHRSVLFVAGLPFRLARFEVDGAARPASPADGRPFTVAAT
jgi:murein DD-endopeptidase MepM/ murein hydrolase activator NlpD